MLVRGADTASQATAEHMPRDDLGMEIDLRRNCRLVGLALDARGVSVGCKLEFSCVCCCFVVWFSLDIRWIFIGIPLDVHWMFVGWSLDVRRMFRGCSSDVTMRHAWRPAASAASPLFLGYAIASIPAKAKKQ